MKLFLTVAMLTLFTACASTQDQESSGEYVDNTAISVKVKSGLLKSKITEGMSIDVESYKGTVILSGFVSNQKQMDKALEIARNVKGVKNVEMALFIKSDIKK